MKPILEINKLSKKYLIKSENKPYLSLRDQLFQFNFSNSSVKEFYALKDVSFKVMAGESIGIIGKNGAGKSTLLRLCAGLAPLARGSARVFGVDLAADRDAVRRSVGFVGHRNGLYGELTARENISFVADLVGASRDDIRETLDTQIGRAHV